MFLNIRYRGPASGLSAPGQLKDGDRVSPICKLLGGTLLLGFAIVVTVSLFLVGSAVCYTLGTITIAVTLFIMFCIWMRSLYNKSLKKSRVKVREQDRRARPATLIMIPPPASDAQFWSQQPATPLTPANEAMLDDSRPPPPYESLPIEADSSEPRDSLSIASNVSPDLNESLPNAIVSPDLSESQPIAVVSPDLTERSAIP